jgi:hypothetical protein
MGQARVGGAVKQRQGSVVEPGGSEATPMFNGTTERGIEGEREKGKGQEKRKEGSTNLGEPCHVWPDHVYLSVGPCH